MSRRIGGGGESKHAKKQARWPSCVTARGRRHENRVDPAHDKMLIVIKIYQQIVVEGETIERVCVRSYRSSERFGLLGTLGEAEESAVSPLLTEACRLHRREG